MSDHIHNVPVCGFDGHNPHAPNCITMHGEMIACGTIVDPNHPDVGDALCRHKDQPVWNPAKWNGDPVVMDGNNCYNYACDTQTGSFAQPGKAGGYHPTAVDCTEYTAGALADGLHDIDCDDPCPSGCWKVALVIAPNDDFHWYRQDESGNWSHKPGHTPAINTDASGNPITDPRTADRDYSSKGGSNYSDFCGCFCVCPPVTIASRGFIPTGDIYAMKNGKHIIEVSFGLFSGRPNPVWLLTQQEIVKFKKMITDLPAAKPTSPGWLDFVVTNKSSMPDFPERIVVHDGIVDVTWKGKTSYFVDKQDVGSWLYKSAISSPMGEKIISVLKKRGVSFEQKTATKENRKSAR